MKIIFLGGCYSDNYDDIFLKDVKRGELALPANIYQREIVRGLIENCVDVYVISCPQLPGYPINFNKGKAPTVPFLLNGENIGVMAGYNLFFALKDFSAEQAYKQ